MRLRIATLIVLGALLAAATPARAEGTSARPAAPGSRPAAAPAKPRTRAATADSAGREAGRAAARTLEDIHIEGEIPVPQVLFITAREQRRFMEFQHHRYLKNSREVGASTVPPSRIVMTRAQTPPERSHPDD